MWRVAQTGKGLKIINATLSSPLGARGLLLVPFVGLAMEKSFYDTAMCLQGIDPNTPPEYHKRDETGRSIQSFPGGGYNLPSLSFVPCRHVREYFE